MLNGCEKDSPIHDAWDLDGWTFRRCPLRLITRETGELIRSYNMLKAFGKFPYGNGGWKEQPPKLIQAFEVIEVELGKVKEKDR